MGGKTVAKIRLKMMLSHTTLQMASIQLSLSWLRELWAQKLVTKRNLTDVKTTVWKDHWICLLLHGTG